jgi:hypothetical protein
MPWSQFTRRNGELREMGPGRRDREQPHQNPVSPVEMLWYRGLVGRAFFDAPGGPEEFAYIPDDLLGLLSGTRQLEVLPLGRPASPTERAHTFSATDIILDHACTLLSALRMGITPPELPAYPPGTHYPLSVLLLKEQRSRGLLDGLPRAHARILYAKRGGAESFVYSMGADSDFNSACSRSERRR